MADIQGLRASVVPSILAIFLAAPIAKGQEATVDWNDEYQVIDGGVGIAFANAINLFYNHPEPVRTYILDQAFSVSKGFGFANCRTQPGSGGGHKFTTRSIQPEPGVWDLDGQYDQVYLSREVTNRGCGVLYTSIWSPPYWMKETNTTMQGGKLRTDMYDDYSDYIVRFFQEYEKRGVFHYTLGLQNEPGSYKYQSMDWNFDDAVTFLGDYLGPDMDAAELKTGVLMAWASTLGHDELLPYYDQIGNHYSDGGNGGRPDDNGPVSPQWYDEFKGKDVDGKGKTVWIDEASRIKEEDPTIPAWRIHHCFANLGLSAYTSWDLFMGTFQHDWGENSEMVQLSHGAYGAAHFARWVRPGHKRIGATWQPTDSTRLSAYKDTLAGTLVLVAINRGHTSASFDTKLENATTQGSFEVWRSSLAEGFNQLADLELSNGTFTVELPGRSVITYVGQGPETTPEILPVPADVEVYRMDRALRVMWRRVPSATGYEISLGDTKSGEYGETRTVGQDLEYTFDNLQNGKTYFISVKALRGGEKSEPSLEMITSPRSPNLLSSATVSVSTSSSGFSPDAVKDGDIYSYWKTPAVEPQWIQFDLGSQKQVGRVGIFWNTEGTSELGYGEQYATHFEILVSNEPTFSAPQRLYQTSKGHRGYIEADNFSGTGRYLRINMLQSSYSHKDRCFAVREIYAYDATTPQVPSCVSDVSVASAGENALKVKWRAVRGADGYNIYRWDNTTDFGCPDASRYRASTVRERAADPIDAGNATEFILDGLTAGIEYGIMVTAYRNKETIHYTEGIFSREVFAEASGVPMPPKLIEAIPGDGRLMVKWKTVPQAQSYKLYVVKAGDKPKNGTGTGSDTVYTVSDCSNGTQYAIFVSAVNGKGESGLSEPLYSTPTATPEAPLVKYGVVSNEIVVSWEPVDGASGYRVGYGTAAGDYDSVIDAGNATAYAITGLENGMTYHCVVAAYNLDATGPWSKDTAIEVIQTTEIILDNDDEGVTLTGTWQVMNSDAPHIGQDFLSDAGVGMENSDCYALYTPTITTPGMYRVYMYYNSSSPKPASNVTIRFNSAIVAGLDQGTGAGEWR